MNTLKLFIIKCLFFKGDFGDKILGIIFYLNLLSIILSIIKISTRI